MRALLADTSAYHRAEHPQVVAGWRQAMLAGTLATCALVRLEVLFSARSLAHYEDVKRSMASMRHIPCGEAAFERALEVQQLLARRPLHHRSAKIADLVIAASAELAGATVWHYDEDFDRIAEITGQSVEWVAPRGSL